ncbi:hypothetical protein [Streptomyces gobiensis]|uniref:hypothetical protein n=1 Tax=Streptomyces gobiensis TaxID=2875706 RepID=UPI001E447127|nr:hypothetical protein [Streptomyces gobiensis]UGY93607.1 hypothetical protein test1122_19030 [Streptomyces gobiensis]
MNAPVTGPENVPGNVPANVPAKGAPAAQGTAGAHPPRTPHPLRTELRRGLGPLSGLLIAAVLCAGMLDKAGSWQGQWGETSIMLRLAAMLLAGPVAVAAGCWQGGRERRRGTGDLLAALPGSRLRRTLAAAAPTMVWPVVGYLLAAVVTALMTWPYASAGGPFLSLLAADAVALAALGLLGFVAGRLMPWRAAAPLLALCTYLALFRLAYDASDLAVLSPVQDHYYRWDQPVWWFGPAAMAWTGGLAAAALLAYAARRRATALVPLAIAAAGAVLLVQTGDGLWRPDPAAAAPVCDDGTPRICVSRVHGKKLPGIAAGMADLRAKLRNVPGAPVRFVSGPHALGPGEVRLPEFTEHYFERNRLINEENFALNAAAAAVFPPGCEAAPDADQYARTPVADAVVHWLAPDPVWDKHFGHLNPEAERAKPEYVRVRKRLSAMSKGERDAWLGEFLNATRACDTRKVSAP